MVAFDLGPTGRLERVEERARYKRCMSSSCSKKRRDPSYETKELSYEQERVEQKKAHNLVRAVAEGESVQRPSVCSRPQRLQPQPLLLLRYGGEVASEDVVEVQL